MPPRTKTAPPAFRLLGELRVTRGDERLKLPPSKKTRALLAYLLLTGRAHRRERLSGMFWDVADDPRGALRWSLSKLRALVDDERVSRMVADRESVELQLHGAPVDVLELRAALKGEGGIANADTATLERLAAGFGGELMEGLDLPDFDDFQAWCIAEREQTRRDRAQILASLCQRLEAEPERALPHARAWAQTDPLDFAARTTLLRVLLSTARRDEASQHYESARRMFEELGSPHLSQLSQLWRELTAQASGATSVRAPRTTAVEPAPARAPSVGPAPRGPRPAPPPLFGRERELEALRARLDAVAAEGTERIVLLSGEPGIGKTRLLEELVGLARERGATIMRGAAFEGETGRPYGPLLDGLRGVGDVAVEELKRDLSVLVPELGGSDAREGSRDRLFSAVADFIATRARQTPPLLLVVDDIQWLDAASAELLHYLARTGHRLPLMVALGARAGELGDNATVARVLRSLRRDGVLEEREVAPLGLDAITALAAQHGASLDAELLERQSGGNPLFALELARMGTRAADALPESVGDAVRDRVERLSTEAADVLRWAAVLGESFGLERLEPLVALDLEAVITGCEELERASLLRRDSLGDGSERYGFAHELVRRAIYADLSEPRRRLMHLRIAQALRDSEDVAEDVVAELAHHAALGHDHDLAASACAAAGLRCQRLFANEQALLLARRGLRHASQLQGPDAVRRRIELLEVQLLASRPEDLAAVSEELRGLAERALEQGALGHARRAFFQLSTLNWEGGAWRDAKRDMLQVEAISRVSDDQDRVWSMADAARCLILLERDLGEAGAMLMEAEARARPLGIEPPAMADARGMLLQHRGDTDEALAAFERAHTLAVAAGDRMQEFQALEHQVMLELERGRLPRARALVTRLVEIGDKLRQGSEAPFARAVEAVVRYGAGEDCLDAIAEGLEALRMVDAKYRLAYVLLQAALFDLARGEPELALSRGGEARAIAELLERPSETLLALCVMARAARELGAGDEEAAARTAIAAGSWHAASARALALRAELLAEA